VRPISLLTLIAAMAAAPVSAQNGAPACPALPRELAGWSAGTPLTAAAAPAELARTLIKPGHRSDLVLAPSSAVTFAAMPNKPPAPTSNSGMAIFTIAEAGTYRVALGTSAWINIVQDGKFLPSTAHSHKLSCTGIRKMVDFSLTPGNYVLQIEGAQDAKAAVLIGRLP